MKLVELIKFSRSILETLSDFDIKTSDVRFVDMYADYEDVSVAKVYRVLRKFRRAVGN